MEPMHAALQCSCYGAATSPPPARQPNMHAGAWHSIIAVSIYIPLALQWALRRRTSYSVRSVQRPALSIGSTTNQSAAAVCVCAVVLSHHTASCRATIVQGLPQSIQWSQWSHTLDAAMHRQRQSNYGLLLPEARTSATAAAARIGSSAVARMRWLDCGGSTAVARQRWHDSGGSTGACKGAGKYSRGN